MVPSTGVKVESSAAIGFVMTGVVTVVVMVESAEAAGESLGSSDESRRARAGILMANEDSLRAIEVSCEDRRYRIWLFGKV